MASNRPGGSVNLQQIENGWDVYGSDGEKVGDVSEVGRNYVVVSRGFIFTKERYIPASAITRIDEDRVYLNVTKDEIEARGWDEAPGDTADDSGETGGVVGGSTVGGAIGGVAGAAVGGPVGLAAGAALGGTAGAMAGDKATSDNIDAIEGDEKSSGRSMTGGMRDTDVRTDTPVRRTGDADVDVTRRGAMDTGVGGARRSTEGEQTIELREEELQARKRMVETGEVEIRKDVVAEQRTIEVPITREEVVVERHAVNRRPSDAPIGSNEVIEVPIREEEVEVEKRAVVYEELEVGKRAVQDTETFTDTVRREVADVRTEGDVDTRGGGDVRREDVRRDDTRRDPPRRS